ncbi:MAG TPA: peptide MFS transporter [Steroidobacteraceae bacterium]|nr:peptide MFS transporter [Steroidobacteraceae bacterium]
MQQAVESVAAAVVADTSFFGQPRGLRTLFMTEMWERFSYYGTRALLILFMTAAASHGGIGLPVERAGAVYGLYTAGVYLFSLPGGWIADRLLGQRQSVFWGGALISAGNLLLAIPGGITLFYIALLVIAMGTGMLKPNVSVMVGELYGGDHSARRDAAFSIFYFGINLGAFIAPLISGTIGETVGYRWGFLAASVAMALGLVQYRMTARWLGNAGLRPHVTDPALMARNRRTLFVGLGLLAVATIIAAIGALPFNVFQLANATGAVMVCLAVLFFGSVFILGRLAAGERRRVALIAVFFVCSALFWAGYEQAGSTFNLFARDYTDRSFLGSYFPAGEHPVSWYQSIQPIFVLLLAPVAAWLWVALDRRSRDPSAAVKLGLGLAQLGLSFIVMMWAAQHVLASGHKALPMWLIVTFLLQTTGELCLSPIGLSNVTKLAPPRYVGQMMGTWFLGMAIGNLAAGLVGGAVGRGGIADMPGQFLRMAAIGGGAGLLMLAGARVGRALRRRPASA